MSPANSKLAINVLVLISKHFINNVVEIENILRRDKYDSNTPLLIFKGVTNDRSEANNSVRYYIILNAVPGDITLTIKQGSIKYLGPVKVPVSKSTAASEIINVPIASEDLLEDVIQEEEDVKTDLNPAEG